jgi:hypothetical protein
MLATIAANRILPIQVALDAVPCYTMCMHNNTEYTLDSIVAVIAHMDQRELNRLQDALDERRGELKNKQSPVLERREYRNGLLQLEGRAYRRKKDGQLVERGPYWYFHYREGGKQRTLYVGRTDNPEAKVDEMMDRKV